MNRRSARQVGNIPAVPEGGTGDSQLRLHRQHTVLTYTHGAARGTEKVQHTSLQRYMLGPLIRHPKEKCRRDAVVLQSGALLMIAWLCKNWLCTVTVESAPKVHMLPSQFPNPFSSGPPTPSPSHPPSAVRQSRPASYACLHAAIGSFRSVARGGKKKYKGALTGVKARPRSLTATRKRPSPA